MAAGARQNERQSAKHTVDAHREHEDPQFFGIAQLAAEFGVTPRAIRFYETKGLLAPQRVNGTRVYARRDRARLALIVRAKAIGISLDEIKHYLELYGHHGEGRLKQLEYVVERSGQAIAELEAKKLQLEQTLEELRHINRVCKQKIAARKR